MSVSTHDEIELPISDFETVLTTTRSVRLRLDYDRQVPATVINDCLRLALQAPTGGNAQDWRFIVIGDTDLKTEIGAIYREGFEKYVLPSIKDNSIDSAVMKGRLGGIGSDGRPDSRLQKTLKGAHHLAENIGRAPWLILPCATRPSPEFGDPGTIAGVYGSIFPAVWSFQLALRSRGLGSIITTLHMQEGADRLAELLGIPANVTQVSLLPVAYTIGTKFQIAHRKPVHEVTYLNQWGKPFKPSAGIG